MQIKEIEISKIIPYENNPRNNDEAVDKVANSIKEFGFKQPIVLDKDNVIVIGHTRLKASEKLGLKKVPCLYADDLTDDQIKALRLADNKTSEFATWDFEKLDLEIDNIELDLEPFGFDLDLDLAFDDEVIEDEIPDVPEEPKAKLGDIYQLGEHRLMCGDATKIDDVEKLMDSNIAELSFTSPPYNVGHNLGYDNKQSKYINDNDEKNNDDYMQFLIDFTNNSLLNSKYTFVNIQSLANNKITLINYLYNIQDYYADTMIWDKGFGQPAMADNVMNSAFEYIHIFSNEATRRIGTKEFRGTVPNIMKLDAQHSNEYSKIHNATFSIEFVSYFIKTFSNKGESVLDLFGGTGTTLIACEQLERKCYMMELDPHYIDVIIERWENFTGRKAEKVL